MIVKIKKLVDYIDTPAYAKEGDAAFDLRSAEEKEIKPAERELIKTGIKLSIPKNHVGLIWDKSGLASKNGIHVMAGVIDSGYRGEICVVLKNLGNEVFKIEKNMKIAQMLIQPVILAELKEVDELDETNRGENGFGSTGLK